MQYVAYKEVSLDGKVTCHYVISPGGDVVCLTHTEFAAETLAHILNTHAGKVLGQPVIQFDWATANEEKHRAA